MDQRTLDKIAYTSYLERRAYAVDGGADKDMDFAKQLSCLSARYSTDYLGKSTGDFQDILNMYLFFKKLVSPPAPDPES